MNEEKTLRFLDHLQSRNYAALGFLSRSTLAEYIARQQVDIEIDNNTPCGYLLFYDGRNHHRPIHQPNALQIRQACISYDARLIEHGKALVSRIIVRANALGYQTITCWVGTDLPANTFWSSLGFIQDGIRKERGRRHPAHYHYTYHLQPQPRDFTLPFATE